METCYTGTVFFIIKYHFLAILAMSYAFVISGDLVEQQKKIESELSWRKRIYAPLYSPLAFFQRVMLLFKFYFACFEQ